jgi:hypothetical protein
MKLHVDPDRGASLVGVLVVLVILGALAAVAVAVVNRDVLDTAALSRLAPASIPEEGGPVAGGAPAPPRSPTAGASPAACLANVRTVEQAAAAKHASDGAFPATVAELVSGHWLDEAPSQRGFDITLEAAAGQPSGKVLVNGLPAEQGCAGAPRSGP